MRNSTIVKGSGPLQSLKLVSSGGNRNQGKAGKDKEGRRGIGITGEG